VSGTAAATRLFVSAEDATAIGHRYDYADAFRIAIPAGDDRSAEQFARDALESAPPPLRALVWTVFRWVLRFDLGPRYSPDHILGWAIVHSTPDEVRLETRSHRFEAVLLGTRPDPAAAKLVTAVTYRATGAGVIWAAVAPLHRLVARILLRHAARSASPA
jgi:hypothetical protein